MSAEAISFTRPSHDPGEPKHEPVKVIPILPADIALNYLSGPLGPQAYDIAQRIAKVALIRPMLPLEHFQALLEEQLFLGHQVQPPVHQTGEHQQLAA